MGKVIEIMHIAPTKEMPLEMFKACYKFSMFSELMHKPSCNTVEWDETCTTIFAEGMDEVLYQMIQDDMLGMTLTVPKEWFDIPSEQLKLF